MKWLLLICILIALVYVYLIYPNMRKKNCSVLSSYYYAHRGFHDNMSDAPENSMKAFALAVDNGYGIEMDVQLTKDDIPVVFHDFTLRRVCGVEGKVRDYTYSELKEFRLCGSDQYIPTLVEFLELVKGRVPLIVEYKSDTMDSHICEVVHPYLEKYEGYYVIESFSPIIVSWYRKNHPQIIRGQLSMRFMKDNHDSFRWTYFAVQHLLTNVIARPDFVAYDYRGRNTLSFILCKCLGAYPIAWTVLSQEVLDSIKQSYKSFIFEGFKPK